MRASSNEGAVSRRWVSEDAAWLVLPLPPAEMRRLLWSELREARYARRRVENLESDIQKGSSETSDLGLRPVIQL